MSTHRSAFVHGDKTGFEGCELFEMCVKGLQPLKRPGGKPWPPPDVQWCRKNKGWLADAMYPEFQFGIATRAPAIDPDRYMEEKVDRNSDLNSWVAFSFEDEHVKAMRIDTDAVYETLASHEVMYRREEIDRLYAPEIQADKKENDAPSGNLFDVRGKACLIRFKGKQVSMGKTLGAQYLAEMLAAPHKTFLADEIHLSIRGQGDADAKNDDMVHDDGLGFCSSEPDKVTTERALLEYKRRIPEIEKEIADAERNGNDYLASEFRREKTLLIDHISKSKTPSGRVKSFTDTGPAESIRKAIERAIRKIDEQHRGLATHLRKAVPPLTQPFSYRPEIETTWTVLR